MRNRSGVLVIVGLLSAVLAGPLQGQDTTSYELPPAHSFFENPPEEQADLPRVLRAFPLSLDAISVVHVAGKQVLYIPVVMREPELPVDVEARTVDPMDWDEQNVASRKLGRRSLYFVEPGRSMLYGVVVDPDELKPQEVGVGLVIVRRIDEKTYDVLIQSNDREVLAAARGRLQKIDPSIGHGSLYPVSNQAPIREKYGAKWDLAPCVEGQGFPMFSCRRQTNSG